MNKHILLVMKYLEGPKTVSVDELKNNSSAARLEADKHYHGCNGGTAAYEEADRANWAAHTAYGAAHYAHILANTTQYFGNAINYRCIRDAIDGYFDSTGEDGQDYLNHLENTKWEN